MQAVSSRPDVTPPDYLKELEKLQDQIPAFDTKEAMELMQAELGYPPSQLFSTLASAPTAAASLGQVCLASGIATAHMSMLQHCILAFRQAMLTFRCVLVTALYDALAYWPAGFSLAGICIDEKGAATAQVTVAPMFDLGSLCLHQ